MAGGAIDPDDPFAPWDTTGAAPHPYRGIDRPRKPVGMVVWGVLLCLGTAGFGCFAGFTPLMLALPATDRPPTAQVVGIAVLYLALAAGCLALAIACLRGRRWTRKVMLALAWPALIVATLTLPVMIFSAATIEVDPATPAAGRTAALAGTAFVGLAGIALSGALILYFGRRTLADQLVAYDSRPSWTDGLPTAVLSLGLCVALAAASFALAAVTTVTPLFGTILRGPPAVALLLTEAVILAAGAWLLFKNRRAGWGGRPGRRRLHAELAARDRGRPRRRRRGDRGPSTRAGRIDAQQPGAPHRGAGRAVGRDPPRHRRSAAVDPPTRRTPRQPTLSRSPS